MRCLVLLAAFLAVAVAQNTCQRPLDGVSFYGFYPGVATNSPILNNAFSGNLVAITFANGSVSESSTDVNSVGNHTVWTATWDITNLVLHVSYSSMLSTNVDTTVYGCDPTVTGVYQAQWSELCTVLSLDVVQDNCYSRRQRYNRLVLSLASTSLQYGCTLPDHQHTQLWNGLYANFNPANELNSKQVQFTLSPGSSRRDVLEQTARGVRRSNWRLDLNGHLFVFDVKSRPKYLSCHDTANAGIYLTNWTPNCNTVVFTAISDSCRGRRELYHGMTISKGGINVLPLVSAAFCALPSIALVLSLAVLAFF